MNHYSTCDNETSEWKAKVSVCESEQIRKTLLYLVVLLGDIRVINFELGYIGRRHQ